MSNPPARQFGRAPANSSCRWSRLGTALTLALGWVITSGCDEKSSTKPAYSPSNQSPPVLKGTPFLQEVTAVSRLNFVHNSGARGEYFMPEHLGSGVAVLDADSDGRMDLYFVQNGDTNSPSKNRLFRQEKGGVFEDVSEGSGLDIAGRGMGAIVGDMNNDGRPDVVVTEFGAVRVLINETRAGQKPVFREITLDSGVDNSGWATAASFIDFDRDGWLDLVIANYVDYGPTERCTDPTGLPEYCGPDHFQGTATRLFRNLGHASGRGKTVFRDVTLTSGLAKSTGPALGLLCADFDGDHWPDIFAADDGKPNRLFMNQRNGTFREEALSRGLAYNAMGTVAGNMGIAVGDVDGNGLFDLFVSHLAQEQHGFWIQDQRGLFMDRVAALGLSNPLWRGTGFGTALVDLDLNGTLDLVWVNGGVRRNTAAQPKLEGMDRFWDSYAQRAQLFRGDNTGRFTDISLDNPEFTGRACVGRGLAVVDYDNDGAPDLVQSNTGGPAQLFRNVSQSKGHWLSLQLVEPTAGMRDAIGAEVWVESENQIQWRLLQPSTSYLSSQDPRLFFGLGNHAHYKTVRVIWPNGAEEQFPGGDADQFRTLRHGEGVTP